jgi:hypothetical protein
VFRFKSASSRFFNNRGPQLQQHADRLLKDNFAPDPDLLLCCAVVKTLYVKKYISEHCIYFLANYFIVTPYFLG